MLCPFRLQRNWMVSIATWKRMQETAQAGVCTPNGEYPGTDEAAALLCSWYANHYSGVGSRGLGSIGDVLL